MDPDLVRNNFFLILIMMRFLASNYLLMRTKLGYLRYIGSASHISNKILVRSVIKVSVFSRFLYTQTKHTSKCTSYSYTSYSNFVFAATKHVILNYHFLCLPQHKSSNFSCERYSSSHSSWLNHKLSMNPIVC